MRRGQLLKVGAAVIMLLSLLGALGSNSGAQSDGGQRVANLPSVAQPSGLAWLDAELSQILLVEGLLLLLVVLEVGLVVAGIEAFDWWRDRRAGEVDRLHGGIRSALQRN